MTPPPRALVPGLLALALASVLPAADTYPPHPDSIVRDGVPKGELIVREFSGSQVFPGTSREVTVYVPRQYDPARPACVHVNQDGVQFNAPAVFDNLIARGELPVIIGVFVRPGVVKAANGDAALDRFNRSFEYDGLGNAYVRFVLDELLPWVETLQTADGRPLRLSKSGNDRLIAGQSSGAIAAFTAAWERPDAFSRVFSAIGTYVDLRGGGRYAALVRRTEPKPIRVFLQDGSDDLNIYAGDWWMANQTLQRALTYANYEVNHVWGEGGHNGRHAAAVFPDAVRWLWKDWPAPVKAGTLPMERLGPLLVPGEDWELVGEGYGLSEGAAVNARGEFFFTDILGSRAYRLDDAGKPSVFIDETQRTNGQAFGPDGRLYAVATRTQQVLVYDNDGRASVLAEGIAGNDVVVAHNGNVYVTHPGSGREPSRLWLIRPDGTKLEVDRGEIKYANGIALSTDQSLLYVADYASHWVYSYVIQPDGTLAHKQRYYWLYSPDSDDQSYADGIKVDRNGNLYVATRLGVQVCDQAGRVHLIIPTPNGRCTNLAFGGPDSDILYVTCNDKVYRRKLNATGAHAWAPPLKPAAPRL